MLNFNRRDAETQDANKNALKPALYEPPGPVAGRTPNAAPRIAPNSPLMTPPSAPAAVPRDPAPAVSVASAPAAPVTVAEIPGSKLFVGLNIKLKGVEISDCDVLVIEGEVEATVNSKAMQIAKSGTLNGTALIDVAEVDGVFSGELTARTRLVVHCTGRVSGTIRYGKLIVEEGGEITGDVRCIDPNADTGQTPALLGATSRHVLGPSSERGAH